MNGIQEKLNDYNIKKKLRIFYICCVLLPLFATDSIILTILLQGEQREQNLQMESISSAVQFDLSYALEEAANMTKNIYVNRTLDEFLNQKYKSGYDFFLASQELISASFYEATFSTMTLNMVMYADNDSIINGGHFYRLSTIREEEWYQKLTKSQTDMIVSFYYMDETKVASGAKRKVSVVRKLNYFKNSNCEKLAKVDLDYSALVRKITSMKYNMPIYVCIGDMILFSNDGHSSYTQDYEYLTGKEKIGYEATWTIYGEDIRILIMRPSNTIVLQIKQHFQLILFLIAVNLLLPLILTSIINKSFTTRLMELSQAFDMVQAEHLKKIENIRGRDEIGSLMSNYNRMVRRLEELIQTVYRDKLERQEVDIARQNAELLALHSQINPHFLFNVLESIRMHSILKGEEETASMIERLAVLERQNVDWSSDFVIIKEEIKFIEAYLELQKYRFGERLSYNIKIEPECEKYCLPKLTLVTFVENACVHGVEMKAVPCWIYVRVYEKEEWLYLEIEDTGGGMDDRQVEELRLKMSNSSIESLKENEHVGIINACLRLKMVTGNKTEFELESEKAVGTCILIKVPMEELSRS